MRITIRFPLVRERTGWKRGLRWHRVPAETARTGQERCVRGMLRCAIRSRDMANHPAATPQSRAFDRRQMRNNALWARIFAQHIEAEDSRVDLDKVTAPYANVPALPL